jgi:hypothetical protein
MDAKLMKTSALGCAFTASAVLHTMTYQRLRHGGMHGGYDIDWHKDGNISTGGLIPCSCHQPAGYRDGNLLVAKKYLLEAGGPGLHHARHRRRAPACRCRAYH